MQEFGKGQYSGKVTAIHDGQGEASCITTYERENFNNKLHYHENTHISLVIADGCGERKRDYYDRLPGMLIFYYASEPHQFMQVKNASRHINLEIEQKLLDQYRFNESRPEPFCPYVQRIQRLFAAKIPGPGQGSLISFYFPGTESKLS